MRSNGLFHFFVYVAEGILTLYKEVLLLFPQRPMLQKVFALLLHTAQALGACGTMDLTWIAR